MEEDLSLEPVQSIAPVLSLQPFHHTIARKYWHIICRAESVIPLGLSSMKISLFLIYYDNRLFLSIVIEFFQMLPAPQENLNWPCYPALSDHSSLNSIPLPCGSIPLGYGVFELPECPRCFLGYTCNSHQPHHL